MNPICPDFIRLPADGEHCPHTGMKRGSMRNLCVPCKANGFKPKVPGKCLRQPGNLRGIWLIPYAALVEFISALPTPGLAVEPAGAAVGRGNPKTTQRGAPEQPASQGQHKKLRHHPCGGQKEAPRGRHQRLLGIKPAINRAT